MNMFIKSIFSLFIFWFSLITCVYADKPLIIGGSGADLGTFRLLATAYGKHHPEHHIKILPSIGSGGGVRGVVSGRIHIGLISRPLKNNEKKYNLNIIHYADTPLVYVVPEASQLKNIDTALLQAIYRGEPQAKEMIPILRPKSDSDTMLLYEFFPEISSALAKAYERKGLPIGMTDQTTIELLLTNVNNISTSTLSLIKSEQQPVRVLSLNSVLPNATNVSNGSYPLKKSCFILYMEESGKQVKQFIEFVRSDEGSAILSQTGHIIPRQ